MPNVPLSPEREAQQLLSTVWGGRPLPVDPIQIAQQLGIEVFTAGLDEGVAGMLIMRRGRDPKIYINGRDSLNRQRFTAAHELGHYVKHVAEDDWEHVDYRDALASQGTNLDEVFANKFAANLLMPKDEVERLKKRHGEGASAAALAYEFGVSVDAMNFRLVNLKLA
ncbi:MAG TPA: ImmA/IrrE family metallo-endopeptidase [Solirubrobacteraceae bacterium]|nr:ImmA/IrrE family metallo-endopeptidase [Solirubrobacteraceae bacterium]